MNPSDRTFQFKQFSVTDRRSSMKVGSDSVLLGALLPTMSPREIMDLGAGCGLLSLISAQKYEGAHIVGVEIDGGACSDAVENFNNSAWKERLEVVNMSFDEYVPEVALDLIVCNPPFFVGDKKSKDVGRATARHQGVLSPETAVEYASRYLSKEMGVLAMVTPTDVQEAVTVAAEFAGLKIRKLYRVVTKEGQNATRLIWHISTQDGEIERTDIVIRDKEGNYTEQYLKIVSPYYIFLH